MDVDELTSHFKVDTRYADTKTPYRNNAVQEAMNLAAYLKHWYQRIKASFIQGHIQCNL